MPKMASFSQERLLDAGFGPAFQQRGLPLDQLPLSWSLVACDIAGGCGSESLSVQGTCLLTNHCDLQSWADYYSRYARPETWRALHRWRELLADSYRTGDWSWLPLDRLRQRYSR